MKRFIAIVPLLLVFVEESAFAQATCTLDCCNECFAYIFCTGGGTQYLMCSNSPTTDGNPTMSFIPSCVTVDNMPPQGIWQPQTAVPVFASVPPDRDAIYHDFMTGDIGMTIPDSFPYYDGWADYWEDDPTEYDAGVAQTHLDWSKFLSGLPQELTDTTGMNDNALGEALSWYGIDQEYLFNAYDDSLANYITDSTAHATGTDVPYTQIWDQAQADTDANDALLNWRSICSPPVPATLWLSGCCLHIVMDSNADDFGVGDDQVGTSAETVGGWAQSGFPACDDTSACPYFARYIQVNVSYVYFEQKIAPIVPDPRDTQYILHSVPQLGFYTSKTAIPTVFTGFSSISFFQLMAHEMGHFLGLCHPDQPVDGIECSNCFTQNPPWIANATTGNYVKNPHAIDGGFQTVMGPVMSPNQPPLQLTNEDTCEFQKLYCPGICITHSGSCLLSGVSQPVPVQPDWFNPQVFPNPSNGGMTLTFDIEDRSFVQITIYDVLGKEVNVVSSGYDAQGPQSMSLGTESLPSGNYVCRVRVGDRAAYINLVIKK